MTKAWNRKTKALAPPRPEPSDRQQAAIEAARETWAGLPCRPGYEVTQGDDGVVKMMAHHCDDEGEGYRMAVTVGSESHGFQGKALGWLLQASRARGKPATSEDVDAALAFVAAVEPRDELEAAMAMQMYATHELAIEMMSRARQADMRNAMQEYGNLATKMTRTFTAQVEALAKLRRGGEQIVRHIHVDNRGGQAVIADTVNTGGVGSGKIADQPHGEGASVAALLGSDAAGYGMPVPGDAQWSMQDARREVAGRAEG